MHTEANDSGQKDRCPEIDSSKEHGNLVDEVRTWEERVYHNPEHHDDRRPNNYDISHNSPAKKKHQNQRPTTDKQVDALMSIDPHVSIR